VALIAVVALVAGACGSDDDDSAEDGGGDAATETTEAAAEAEPLKILVTNDDGVEGEGIDALVEALSELPDTEITVVAPLEDQSGTGDTTSPRPPAASDTTLVSGHEAIAVAGYPADAVTHGLDEVLGEDPPDLVVSGINAGQNLGPVAFDLSGTVGAARTAAKAGIPALAVSQGFGEAFDFPTAVDLTLSWIDEHRRPLVDGEVAADTVANLNVPSCDAGEIKGLVEVITAVDLADRNILAPSDCTAEDPTGGDPADDLDAFTVGYATLADVPLDPPA
jgi:5'-nucleotidase